MITTKLNITVENLFGDFECSLLPFAFHVSSRQIQDDYSNSVLPTSRSSDKTFLHLQNDFEMTKLLQKNYQITFENVA